MEILNKYYKIIPIAHLLKNNSYGYSRDVIKGDRFIDLVESLSGGYCVEATAEEIKAAGIEVEN